MRQTPGATQTFSMPVSSLFRRRWCNVCVAATFALTSVPAFADDAGQREDGHVLAFAMPVADARKTSGFATRRHPIRKTLHFHAGIDLAAPHGTPVRSVADGRVEFAGTRNGYGNVVYIEHGDGRRTTVYAHLSRIDVREGQPVTRGETIGAVGSSGAATGPHLHFEVREGGRPVDPSLLAYLPAVEVAPPMQVAIAPTPPERCLELLMKASLEALDSNELDALRGCAQ